MKRFDSTKFCDKVISLFGDVGQVELSEEIGISQGVISAIKNKKSKVPGADTLFKIARYYNVSLDWLVGAERNSVRSDEDEEIDTVEIFAERLIKLREFNNLTRDDLAKACGVTKQSISRYEKGERRIHLDMLVKVACHFNVSSDYLLGLSDSICADTEGCDKYISHAETKMRSRLDEIANELERMAASIRD